MLFESLLIAVGAGATRTIGRNGTLKKSGTTKRNGVQMRALRVGGGSVAVTCVAPSAPVHAHSERAQAAGLLTETTTARCYCPEPVLVKATTHTAKTTAEQSPRFAFPFFNSNALTEHSLQLCETPLFFEFSLCLPRACLGEMMHFIYKWRKKWRF